MNKGNFYPRSPRGERPQGSAATANNLIFLSTLPARGATVRHLPRPSAAQISIHAPREGSDHFAQVGQHRMIISIHAPREGSDSAGQHRGLLYDISIHAPREGSDADSLPGHGKRPISIHAPREGSDKRFTARATHRTIFLSTLPARGATFSGRWVDAHKDISIHAPREGSDSRSSRRPCWQ